MLALGGSGPRWAFVNPCLVARSPGGGPGRWRPARRRAGVAWARGGASGWAGGGRRGRRCARFV